jgi:hypothetical protein
VNSRHLRRQHRLQLILRFDSLDDREHEIELLLVWFPAVCRCELSYQACKESRIRCPKRLHDERWARQVINVFGREAHATFRFYFMRGMLARSAQTFSMASTSCGVRSRAGFAFATTFDFREVIDSPSLFWPTYQANQNHFWLVPNWFL